MASDSLSPNGSAIAAWLSPAVDSDTDALASAALPAQAMRISADVADGPTAWVASVQEHLGPPTVLVNNAAHEGDRSFLELPLDAVRRSLDVTLLGTWAVTRAVVELMIQAQQPGSVIFNLSLHARRVRLRPDYSVAKAGLLMLMKELANELEPHGIRVNAVSPGAIDTWSDRVPDADTRRARTEALVPLRRVGHPQDVAKAIAFLADNEAAAYISGANLKVDGGLDQYNWLHHLYGSASSERQSIP